MGSCAAPSAKGDDKFITTDYLQQCLLKGLSMLSKGWPGIFSEAAHNLAFETLEHAIRADHIDSDRCLIKSIYYNLFSGEDSNKKP
ncbi:hypothetical protein GZZ97_27355 [Klebsiella pneumoniae]|nr:hypothetical protein [Klebsiella pneumoniae]MBK0522712.1 hypothetical protein [Klebsiella pneumoniae]MBK0593968.1 hypothetical protein [Klebsiella pneumoniae]